MNDYKHPPPSRYDADCKPCYQTIKSIRTTTLETPEAEAGQTAMEGKTGSEEKECSAQSK